jgi:hypothetical protein
MSTTGYRAGLSVSIKYNPDPAYHQRIPGRKSGRKNSPETDQKG